MTRIHRYVLRHDSGMAPHPWEGIISLATCKPDIRAHAIKGDWVLGNRSAPHHERVVWAGRVSEVVEVGEYPGRFPRRLDALYPPGPDGVPERDRSKLRWYHDSERDRTTDTRGRILLFDPQCSWYFGADARSLPGEIVHLAHKWIGHSNRTKPGDIVALLAWLESESAPGIIGKPRDPLAWTRPFAVRWQSR